MSMISTVLSRRSAAVGVVILAALCASAPARSDDRHEPTLEPVRTWNELALDTVRLKRLSDAQAGRLYAAVNGIVSSHGDDTDARAHALVPYSSKDPKGDIYAAASAEEDSGGQTWRVRAGESIQEALDGASPGDKVQVDAGEYYEQLVIEKDGITLVGAGASEDGTVLLPPDPRQETNCSYGTYFQDGICILPNPTADGITVKGFLIRGFPDGGVTALYASNLTVKNVWADQNIVGFYGEGIEGVTLKGNVLSDNWLVGIYFQSSPAANASVIDNEVYGHLTGIVADDSSHGTMRGNYAHDNCIGLVLFYHNHTGLGTTDWTVTGNRVNHNNRSCPADSHYPGSPAVSGGGIGIHGATDSIVKGNEVLDNQPAFPNRFAGGIEIHSTTSIGGSDPTNDLIQGNDVRGNLPYDLAWDGSGSPTFKENDCETSNPADLCE